MLSDSLKLISPEENKSFRLKEPVKVVMELANMNRLPDSVLISFDGKAVATLKVSSMGIFHTSALYSYYRKKSLKVTAYRGGQITKSYDQIYNNLFGYCAENERI